jgi:hypothetical protein
LYNLTFSRLVFFQRRTCLGSGGKFIEFIFFGFVRHYYVVIFLTTYKSFLINNKEHDGVACTLEFNIFL